MLTIYRDIEQGSPEWFALRLGIPTASVFSAVLAKGEGKTRRTLMMKLLGERLTGQPAENYQNAHMDRGREMEAEARETYALTRDADLEPVAFIRNGGTGCSPDSLVGHDGMIEIKTALPHIQIERIFADKVPPEYVAQVQGQLWIAEREYCDFISYWPRLPLFVKRAYRDEAYIKTLAAEVERFNAELDALAEKLKAQGASLAEIPRAAAA